PRPRQLRPARHEQRPTGRNARRPAPRRRRMPGPVDARRGPRRAPELPRHLERPAGPDALRRALPGRHRRPRNARGAGRAVAARHRGEAGSGAREPAGRRRRLLARLRRGGGARRGRRARVGRSHRPNRHRRDGAARAGGRARPSRGGAPSRRAGEAVMRMRRLRRGVGTSTAVFALGTALLAPTVLTSSASWTDVEYDAGNLGALDCAPERLGTSTAAGTLLGGTLLGLDLGTLAEVRGLRVSDTGAGAMPDPASASVVPDSDAQAYQNPLVVSAAFDAINLELGELLHLPLETQLGVAGQYGRASADASSAGAAGTITQGGGIDLAAMSAPPDERP